MCRLTATGLLPQDALVEQRQEEQDMPVGQPYAGAFGAALRACLRAGAGSRWGERTG